MQHTEQYQLNLIEKNDVFSPDALNENAQKVENALRTKADVAETGPYFAALAAQIAALEGKKIAIGTYTGTGNGQIPIQLPFAPAAMVIQMINSNQPYIVMQGITLSSNGTEIARLEGAALYAQNNAVAVLNYSDKQYAFLAFPQ